MIVSVHMSMHMFVAKRHGNACDFGIAKCFSPCISHSGTNNTAPILLYRYIIAQTGLASKTLPSATASVAATFVVAVITMMVALFVKHQIMRRKSWLWSTFVAATFCG
jgi:hypothetical protein